MDPQARAERLLSYARGPQALRSALERYPEACLDFEPRLGAWSIRAIVLHLAESELHAYLRARTIISEPGTAVAVYDQDRWVETLAPSAQPLGEALALFGLLREMLARHLRGLDEAAWTRWIDHPVRGRVTLEDWLVIYDEHLRVHLAQMDRAREAWRG